MTDRPTYGYTDPRNYKLASLPEARDLPPEIKVTEHMVGYTQVTISTGEVIRFHLFVDRLVLNRTNGQYDAEYRMVPESVRRTVMVGDYDAAGRA